MFGSNYGSIAYLNLKRELQKRKLYAEGSMKVTGQSFQSSVVKLKRKVFESKGHQYSVLAAPAPFCSMRYFNALRCLEGDSCGTESGRTREKKPSL